MWNLFKKSPAEEESLKLSQIQAQLEKANGLVFNDDVFELEAKVHQYFDQKRVNAFNRHKEFFRITPAEAVCVLTNKFNCKVTFVDENNMEEFENENDEKEK